MCTHRPLEDAILFCYDVYNRSKEWIERRLAENSRNKEEATSLVYKEFVSLKRPRQITCNSRIHRFHTVQAKGTKDWKKEMTKNTLQTIQTKLPIKFTVIFLSGTSGLTEFRKRVPDPYLDVTKPLLWYHDVKHCWWCNFAVQVLAAIKL